MDAKLNLKEDPELYLFLHVQNYNVMTKQDQEQS
jgi:hypothetical protein